MTLQEIINATNADAALTALHDAIKTNKWDSPILKPFKAVENELTSTTHGVIFEEHGLSFLRLYNNVQ